MNPEEMKRRTTEYALRVLRLVRSLPKEKGCNHIGQQLLRCGTSVAANYRAACRARSRAEFVAKMGIVEEEADESLFWVELLALDGIVKEAMLKDLMREGHEIVAIAVASKRTARAAATNRQSSIVNRQSV